MPATDQTEIMSTRPDARRQYADWKRWPNIYAEPTHEEWAALVDRREATIKALRIDLKEIADGQITAAATPDVISALEDYRELILPILQRAIERTEHV